MKIAIAYPPFDDIKGIPLLSQNRQYQIAHSPTYIYPVVPAYTATLLKNSGFDVAWLDGIAEELSFKEWLKRLKKTKPDLLMIETKTPVIKKHWEIINRLKVISSELKIILVGDHVTALPEESFKKSEVDYILTGGDYDFLLLNLVNNLAKGEKLEPGIYYREKGKIKNSGKFKLNHNLNKLPFIDRALTRWQLYAYKNSNFGRIPGTYTMFGRDCWWGRCSFCSWTTLYPGKCYRAMTPKRALDEIGFILKNRPVKEIMDDSGTFPTGDWLREFCQGLIERKYHKKIRLSVNMRFNADLAKKDYLLMGRAGFRFILYGLESSNQKTLDKINKNLKVEQIEKVLSWAKEAGLNPHITVMVGYPWETKKDTQKTLSFAKSIFKRGLADTIQATIVVPYPGTPLFKEAKKKKWLKTLDWQRYDMREAILKTKVKEEEVQNLVQGFYKSIFSPRFILRKIKEGFGDWDVFKYYLRLGLKFPIKLLDFKKEK